jgi:hypothetical protein
MDMSDIADVTAHFRYAMRSLNFGNVETAARIQNELSRRRPNHPYVKRLTVELLAIQMKYDALTDYVNEWAQSDRLKPNDITPLQRLWLETRVPALFDIVKAAIEYWPFAPTLRYLGLQMGLIAPSKTAADVMKRPLEKLPPFLAAEEAWYMAKVGHIEEAIKLVETLTPHWPKGYDTEWDEHVPALSTLPQDADLKRDVITQNQDADWLMTAKGTSNKLIIVTAALYGGTFIPRNLLDRYFAALGHRVIYLRDDAVEYFLNGVASRGPDLVATHKALAAEIDKVGALNTTLLALSASSFQGVRTAIALGIQHVVQFGPLTQAGALGGVLIGDGRGIAIRTRTDTFFKASGDTISPDLHNAPEGFTVDAFYSPHMQFERVQAAKLQPFECVNLWCLEDTKRHNTLSPILENGALGAVLDRNYELLREKLNFVSIP